MQNFSTDVLIIGGGAAGFSLGVNLARSNRDVLLVERDCFFGGCATNSNVGTICGMFKRSMVKDLSYLNPGFSEEFVESLRKREKDSRIHTTKEGLRYISYKIENFIKVCDELAVESKLRYFFNSFLLSVEKEKEFLKSCILLANGKKVRIKFNTLIDASGTATSLNLLDTASLKDKEYQTPTFSVTLGGVNLETEAELKFHFYKEVLKSKEGINYSILPDSYKEKTFIVKITILEEFNPDDLEKSSYFDLEARRLAFKLIEKLKDKESAFSNLKLLSLSNRIGNRVSERGAGEYLLTKEDLIESKKFTNSICNAAWPIEKWTKDKSPELQLLEEESYYQIPFESLKSKDFKNLFFLGRNICADSDAISSARVIGTCFAMGEGLAKYL